MLAKGEWRATVVTGDTSAIGFQLAALYSPLC
jgi:hypothetical protein